MGFNSADQSRQGGFDGISGLGLSRKGTPDSPGKSTPDKPSTPIYISGDTVGLPPAVGNAGLPAMPSTSSSSSRGQTPPRDREARHRGGSPIRELFKQNPRGAGHSAHGAPVEDPAFMISTMMPPSAEQSSLPLQRRTPGGSEPSGGAAASNADEAGGPPSHSAALGSVQLFGMPSKSLGHGMMVGDMPPFSAGMLVQDSMPDGFGFKARPQVVREESGEVRQDNGDQPLPVAQLGGGIERMDPPPVFASHLAPLQRRESRLENISPRKARSAIKAARSETAAATGTTGTSGSVSSPRQSIRTGKTNLAQRPSVPSAAHDIIVTGLTKNLIPQ